VRLTNNTILTFSQSPLAPADRRHTVKVAVFDLAAKIDARFGQAPRDEGEFSPFGLKKADGVFVYL